MYERWGATEKAAMLREKCATLAPYDSLRSDTKPRSKVIFVQLISEWSAYVIVQKSTTVSSIDLDVIVQASQTISNEVCTIPPQFCSCSFFF